MNTYTGSRSHSAHSDGLIRPRLSRPLLVIAGVSLAAGVVTGGVSYLDRSPEHEAHVDGTAALGAHVLLFALAAALVFVVIRRRGIDAFCRMLLAPLSTTAAQRFGRTVRSILNHPTALLRLLLGILPLALLVYSPFRIGVQVLGGLDPNFTVNAWGGPSYLGAMAFHYFDGALLITAAAGMLHLLLLPAGHGKPADMRRR
ncbi:hypothetical protein ACQPW1_26785 [Nocardia sp. CA-128927]|uniref:hypothetical protein n=1 Tax=Nocardia sp. CA-128927 TaxID=3239975 RepID=UPI003D97B5AF